MSKLSNATPSLLLAAVVALPFLGSCTSTGAYRAKVTPQRPTVSNTTETAAFGTVELEAGVSLDPSDRTSADVTARVGLSESSELFIEHAPYINIDRAGEDANGPGGLAIGFRQRLLDESRDFPATAIEFKTVLPVGEDDLNRGGGVVGFESSTSGFTDFFAAISVDRHFGDLLTTWYYQLGVLGTGAAGDLDTQHTLAVAGSMELVDRWHGVLELATSTFTETDVDPMSANAALMFEVTESLLFDIGLQVGLNDDAPDLVVVGGFTTNIGRIF